MELAKDRALRLAEEIAAHCRAGHVVDMAPIQDLIASWTISTAAGIAGRWGNWLTWWKADPVAQAAATPLCRAALGEFAQHLEERSITPKTVIGHLSCVKQFLEALGCLEPEVEAEYERLYRRYRSQARTIESRVSHRHRAFEWSAIRRCIDHVDLRRPVQIRNIAILLILYDAMATPAQLLGHRVYGEWRRAPVALSDIDRHSDGSGRLHLTNGREARQAYLSPLAMSWLDRWLAVRPPNARFLFTLRSGKACTAGTWPESMRTLMVAAGLPSHGGCCMSPKLGMAKDLMRAGVHIDDVRRSGGWRKVRSVVHLFDAPRCAEPTRRLLEQRQRTGRHAEVRIGSALTAGQVRDSNGTGDLFEAA